MAAALKVHSADKTIQTIDANNPLPVQLQAGGGGAVIGQVDVVTATPTSYNLTLTLANTEYTQTLAANCRGFEFQARTSADVRYAFVTGHVAGSVAPYHTLKAGDYYYSPQLYQGGAPSTLFLASATAGTVVEILAWS